MYASEEDRAVMEKTIALLNRLLNLKDCPKVVSVSGSLVLSCGRLRILGGCWSIFPDDKLEFNDK
jgi:hypothetical protein